MTSDQKRPDLPDIMATGMGLTDALAWWNEMMNSGETPESSWMRLRENDDGVALKAAALH